MGLPAFRHLAEKTAVTETAVVAAVSFFAHDT